jgi:hypothetical protein
MWFLVATRVKAKLEFRFVLNPASLPVVNDPDDGPLAGPVAGTGIS